VPLPVAAGTNVSGVIEQIGSQVSDQFKVGEEVAGMYRRVLIDIFLLWTNFLLRKRKLFSRPMSGF
jgi:NADPH:quinone reductase-like Zn-dependent oxidoreductase